MRKITQNRHTGSIFNFTKKLTHLPQKHFKWIDNYF
jgi:hypothetical protein